MYKIDVVVKWVTNRTCALCGFLNSTNTKDTEGAIKLFQLQKASQEQYVLCIMLPNKLKYATNFVIMSKSSVNACSLRIVQGQSCDCTFWRPSASSKRRRYEYALFVMQKQTARGLHKHRAVCQR